MVSVNSPGLFAPALTVLSPPVTCTGRAFILVPMLRRRHPAVQVAVTEPRAPVRGLAARRARSLTPGPRPGARTARVYSRTPRVLASRGHRALLALSCPPRGCGGCVL